MITYIRYPKLQKPNELINLERLKDTQSTCKNPLFPHARNEQQKNKISATTPFMIVPKIMKNLDINLAQCV